MAVTWSPTDKSGVALSNNNLTIAGSTNTVFGSARATLGRNTGKRYFEVRLDALSQNYMFVGLANASASLVNQPSATLNAWQMFPFNNGYFRVNNGSSVLLGGSNAVGHVLMIAADLTAGKLWFGYNGAWFGADPGAGTGAHYTNLTGTLYPIATCRGAATTQWTARFTATAFSYAPPAGFAAWDTFTEVLATDSAVATDAVRNAMAVWTLANAPTADALSGFLGAMVHSDNASTDSLFPPALTAAMVLDHTLSADTLLGAVQAQSLRSNGAITDRLQARLGISTRQADGATTHDQLQAVLRALAAESITLIDTLLPITRCAAPRYDTLFAHDALRAALVISGPISTATRSADHLSGVRSAAALTDNASAHDSAPLPGLRAAMIMDQLTSQDALIAVTAVRALLDSAIFVDRLTSNVRITGRLADTVSGQDHLAGLQLLWMINADTGAVSSYRLPWTVRGARWWRGVLYFATEAGVVSLDSLADEGAPIAWEFRSGFSHFGSDLLKSMPSVNVLASGAPATLLLVHDRVGIKQEWAYPFNRVAADAMRDQVIHAGKGAQSVYWQIGAKGSGPTEIHQLRPVIIPLSRRR